MWSIETSSQQTFSLMKTAQSKFVILDWPAVFQVLPVPVCSSKEENSQKRIPETEEREYKSNQMIQMRTINLSWRMLRWLKFIIKMFAARKSKIALSRCLSSSLEEMPKNQRKQKKKSVKRWLRGWWEPKRCAKTWRENSLGMSSQDGIELQSLYYSRKIMVQQLTCGQSDVYLLSYLEWWRRAPQLTSIGSLCSLANLVSLFHQIEMLERKGKDFLFRKMTN